MLVEESAHNLNEENRPIDQPAVDRLACRARAGCHDAFNQLAEYFTEPLTRAIAVRHHGNVSDAEDVVQESLMKAFRSITSYDERHSFRTWLFTIAFRVSTDSLRRKQIRRVERIELESIAKQEDPQNHERDQPNVWQVASKCLSEVQYSALWLAYAEEMNIAEIAKVLGKAQVTTRVLLYRARRKLHYHITQSESSPLVDRGESR